MLSAERAALKAFYEATNGADWRENINWLSDASLGEWHGVTTGYSGRVIELNLRDNQLSGEIPPELGGLSILRKLDLRVNQLSGEIPPELGDLSILEWLDLSVNQLSGEIPPELGGLSKLRTLYLNVNQLSGCIPSGLRDVGQSDLLGIGLPFCG